jgi:hypothetical protein
VDDPFPTIPDELPERLHSDFLDYHQAFTLRHHELFSFHSILKKYCKQAWIAGAVSKWTTAFHWKVCAVQGQAWITKRHYKQEIADV